MALVGCGRLIHCQCRKSMILIQIANEQKDTPAAEFFRLAIHALLAHGLRKRKYDLLW
jgi:hypothetical protein